MNQRLHSQTLTRREAIKLGTAMGSALLVWPAWSAPTDGTTLKQHAKSVIQIWMWGGPSHLDTFDPKPDAGRDYCGPLSHPIETNVDGVQISELLPQLAKQADKFSIIRSMTHGVNAHETAAYLMQTGREPGRYVYPSVGAVVSRFRGYDSGYKAMVPPYVVLTQAQGRFSESGLLGLNYKPFCTGGDPNADPFVVEGIVARGISDARQKRRRALLHDLDTLGRLSPNNPTMTEFDQAAADAYEMMLGKSRELFDLGNEKDDLRDRYGRNTFGQSCLMARRLVEAGVPYVTINYRGWDTHKTHFETMKRKLPELDAGMATLLGDLSKRGLLGRTIVWWGGEFGRSPKVQWKPPWNGGRGHYGRCFSCVLAGGGFEGGRVVGASDDRGAAVKERLVYPRDLIGSIYNRMGIDPTGPLPNPRGLKLTVLPTETKAHDGGGLLTEIMKS